VTIDSDTLKDAIVANFATEFGEIQPRGLKGLESATTALADAIVAAHNADVMDAVVLVAGGYTAAQGDRVLYNPAAGPYTVKAPSSPNLGDRWSIKERTNSTTAITISGNATNIEDPGSSTFVASFSLALALVAYDFIYDGTNWIII
jgi:hypothetical protein